MCSRKSSSRWFKVSEALHEDVWKYFNVKERVVLGDESLCASCREIWLGGEKVDRQMGNTSR